MLRLNPEPARLVKWACRSCQYVHASLQGMAGILASGARSPLRRPIASARLSLTLPASGQVQSNHFTDFLSPELQKAGYSAIYKKKTTEIFTGNSYAIDGCATFFRRDRFSLVKKYEVTSRSTQTMHVFSGQASAPTWSMHCVWSRSASWIPAVHGACILPGQEI